MCSLLLCLDFYLRAQGMPRERSLDQLSRAQAPLSTESGTENGTAQIKTKANRPSDMIAVPHCSTTAPYDDFFTQY